MQIALYLINLQNSLVLILGMQLGSLDQTDSLQRFFHIPEDLKMANTSIPGDSWVKYLVSLIVCSYFVLEIMGDLSSW
jgi:hypothetical protein